MKYQKSISLKNKETCIVRNVTKEDTGQVLANYLTVHKETDFLLAYPNEKKFCLEEEAQFLEELENSADMAQLCAVVDGKIVGQAGLNAVGVREKVRHRAKFGVGVEKAYWNQGIGTALLMAGITCARQAGYEQLELEVVADNPKAIAMYEKAGFVEYGRNPKGFRSRYSGWQEVVLMRLELEQDI